MSIAFDLFRALDGCFSRLPVRLMNSAICLTRKPGRQMNDLEIFRQMVCSPLPKEPGCNPRELAQKLIDRLPQTDEWNVEIAGPGFINFKLSNFTTCMDQKVWFLANSQRCIRDEKPCKVVIDYSSPNTAKQMHVGHIRSTIIGESLSRMLDFQGHEVVRDNHLGDWGTQFGILLLAIKKQNISLDQLGDDPIAKLEDLYRDGKCKWSKRMKSALKQARQELVKLQDGDEENLALWEKIRDISMSSFEKIMIHARMCNLIIH